MADPHQRKVPATSRSSSDPRRVGRRGGRVADLLSFDNETTQGRRGRGASQIVYESDEVVIQCAGSTGCRGRVAGSDWLEGKLLLHFIFFMQLLVRRNTILIHVAQPLPSSQPRPRSGIAG